MTTPSEAMLPFLADRLGRDCRFAFRPPFAEWQQALRRHWLAMLPGGDIASRPIGKAGRLSLHRFRYGTGAEGEAALLLPDGKGPFPAIVLLHDHGGEFSIGWRKMVAGHGGDAHIARHYDGRALADWLSTRGYAVLITDALGWGSRFAGGYDQQQALAAQAMQAGWSLAGIVAAEDLQGLHWLAGRPEIDPHRIAAMGFSFGGFRAWQLAALEPRVRATVALSWIGRRKDLLHAKGTLVKGQSAFYMLHPELDADFPDMAGLAADRPMFLRVGGHDRHFPPAAVEPAFAALRQIARAADGALDAALFDGAHHCPLAIQQKAAEFLDRHLM